MYRGQQIKELDIRSMKLNDMVSKFHDPRRDLLTRFETAVSDYFQFKITQECNEIAFIRQAMVIRQELNFGFMCRQGKGTSLQFDFVAVDSSR